MDNDKARHLFERRQGTGCYLENSINAGTQNIGFR